MQPESNPISDETLALIKEKHRLRRQYSQKKDPAIKTCINQLQKQVKEELKVESLVSSKKFCNSISLETDSNECWHKIKNFLKPKGLRDYPNLRDASKVAKTNADKAQLFAESVERHFGIEALILIRITSMRSINLSRIIIHIFILMKTQMTTDLMWEMSTSFGTVANGTLPGRKYICSPLKSKVNILGFRWNFWFVIASIAYEDQLCVKIFNVKCVFIGQLVSKISKFLTAYMQLKP